MFSNINDKLLVNICIVCNTKVYSFIFINHKAKKKWSWVRIYVRSCLRVFIVTKLQWKFYIRNLSKYQTSKSLCIVLLQITDLPCINHLQCMPYWYNLTLSASSSVLTRKRFKLLISRVKPLCHYFFLSSLR